VGASSAAKDSSTSGSVTGRRLGMAWGQRQALETAPTAATDLSSSGEDAQRRGIRATLAMGLPRPSLTLAVWKVGARRAAASERQPPSGSFRAVARRASNGTPVIPSKHGYVICVSARPTLASVG
jgi:hypothetical protein